MKPKFYRKILKNGMTVILEKRSVPVVSLAFAVKSGAAYESASEKGISHFIEHMLFKGTTNRTCQQIAQEIEKRGGELNAFTDENLTAYWCKIPSKHLNIALDVLSDLVKNPLFDKIELEKERLVIFEEIKMYKDNPRYYVLNEIKSHLYKSPFGLNIAGNFETMKSISRENLVKKFKDVYVSENMILCAVGDADFEELCNFAEKNFQAKKNKIISFKIEKINSSNFEKRKGIDQANLILGYHVPNSLDKNAYVPDVLNYLLAGGMSSRLWTEIREKRNLAYSVKGDSQTTALFGYNFIYVGTTKENVEEVKRLIIHEIEDISKNLKLKELDEVKEQIIGNHYISLEDSQTQMANLLYSEADKNAADFYEFEQNILKVNIDEVKLLAKEAYNNHSFFALLPE